MDAVGVDGAILVSSLNLYRFDPSYALHVHASYPGRFAVVKPVDTLDPAVGDVIADWASTAGAVGVRILLRETAGKDATHSGIDRTMAAAAKHRLPVNFLCWGDLDIAAGIVARNPDTVIVIDHLGLLQPNEPPVPAAAWADLPKLLALAAYPNVRVKVSGACTLSHAPFPYPDIWDPLARVFDAFGLDRCMWGTDWTRTTGMLTYQQGVDAFRGTDRLSDTDKATLMGGTLTRVYGWAPGPA
jgi:L-fuconolactonase